MNLLTMPTAYQKPSTTTSVAGSWLVHRSSSVTEPETIPHGISRQEAYVRTVVRPGGLRLPRYSTMWLS